LRDRPAGFISAINQPQLWKNNPRRYAESCCRRAAYRYYIENLLKQYPQYFDTVLQHRKDWNVQVIIPRLTVRQWFANLKQYNFNVDKTNIFILLQR